MVDTNINSHKVTKETYIIEPRQSGMYYHYNTKKFAWLEATACTVADSGE